MFRSRPIRVASSALLLVALTLASILTISAARGGAELAAEIPMEDVNQRVLINQGGNSYALFDPLSGEQSRTFEGTAMPVVSEDGRLMVIAGHERRDGAWHNWVTAISTETYETLWRADICVYPEEESPPGGFAPNTQVAITDDRVHVVSNLENGGGRFTLVTLDREDGRETSRQHLESAAGVYGWTRIFALPGDEHLAIIAQVDGDEIEYLRLNLPDFELDDRHEVRVGASLIDGLMAGAGRLLYRVEDGVPGTTVWVRPFDLETGEFRRTVAIALDGDSGADFHFSPSGLAPDGEHLYVLTPVHKQLAVVNLVTSELERTIPLDLPLEAADSGRASRFDRLRGWLSGLLVQDASAKFFASGGLAVSADGTQIYASAYDISSGFPESDGIWVIDAETGKVSDHWLQNEAVADLVLAPDGRYLYALLPDLDFDGLADLLALHTYDGRVAMSVDGQAPQPLAALRRDTCGWTPDSDSTATISIVAEMSPREPLPDEPVTVTARLFGEDGSPVMARATVRGSFTSADGEPVDFALTPDGESRFTGETTLPSPGDWQLSIVAKVDGHEDEPGYLHLPVRMQPAFHGSDGRWYVPRFETDPVQPVSGEGYTARVVVVEAESGELLPEDVGLTPALPDSLKVEFGLIGPGNQASISILDRVAPGVYEGLRTSFSQPEQVRIHMPAGGDNSAVIDAGVLATTTSAFDGDDGRRYVLALTSSPEIPKVGDSVDLTFSFVDIETGQPLPASVTIDEGVPESITVRFEHEQLYPRATTDKVVFESISRGVYSASLSFPRSGLWIANVTIQGKAFVLTIHAGTVEVEAAGG